VNGENKVGLRVNMKCPSYRWKVKEVAFKLYVKRHRKNHFQDEAVDAGCNIAKVEKRSARQDSVTVSNSDRPLCPKLNFIKF
jgi:hypothetical protein